MQAQVKMQNDIFVVSLKGRIDVETAEPFRAACLRELRGKRIVFDFSELLFVGSQGVLPFLETLQSFHDSAPGCFKISGVGPDFRKLLAATPLCVVAIYDTVDGAMAAFYRPAASEVTQAAQAAPLASGPVISYRADPVGSDDEIEA